jgi:hypothetical protein
LDFSHNAEASQPASAELTFKRFNIQMRLRPAPNSRDILLANAVLGMVQQVLADGSFLLF